MPTRSMASSRASGHDWTSGMPGASGRFMVRVSRLGYRIAAVGQPCAAGLAANLSGEIDATGASTRRAPNRATIGAATPLRRALGSKCEGGERGHGGPDRGGADACNDRRRDTLAVEPAFGEQKRR